MIKILQNWEEVGRSIGKLREKNCGYHPDPIKNWDLVQISDLTKGLDKTSRILDMGCGGSATLGFLHRAGFKKVKGIDKKEYFLSVPWMCTVAGPILAVQGKVVYKDCKNQFT